MFWIKNIKILEIREYENNIFLKYIIIQIKLFYTYNLKLKFYSNNYLKKKFISINSRLSVINSKQIKFIEYKKLRFMRPCHVTFL